jgi:hypothetical protein
MVKHRRQPENRAGQMADISYARRGLALNRIAQRFF